MFEYVAFRIIGLLAIVAFVFYAGTLAAEVATSPIPGALFLGGALFLIVLLSGIRVGGTVVANIITKFTTQKGND